MEDTDKKIIAFAKWLLNGNESDEENENGTN